MYRCYLPGASCQHRNVAVESRALTRPSPPYYDVVTQTPTVLRSVNASPVKLLHLLMIKRELAGQLIG